IFTISANARTVAFVIEHCAAWIAGASRGVPRHQHRAHGRQSCHETVFQPTGNDDWQRVSARSEILHYGHIAVVVHCRIGRSLPDIGAGHAEINFWSISHPRMVKMSRLQPKKKFRVSRRFWNLNRKRTWMPAFAGMTNFTSLEGEGFQTSPRETLNLHERRVFWRKLYEKSVHG